MRGLGRAALAGVLAVALVTAPPVSAMGPFERNDPRVAAGMEAFDKGDYEGALKKFVEAQKDSPQSAGLEFDRGNALYKLGRLDEAKEAYHRVAELDQGELRSKDYYNLGDAWAGLGNNKEATAAFRKALTLDPRDEQARHNLEVMLRKLPPPKQDGPDGGTDGGMPDAGRDGGRLDAGGRDGGTDGGQDGGADGGKSDGGQGDGGADGGGDGGQGDGGAGQGDKKPGDAGQSQSPEKSDGGADAGEGPDAGLEEPDRASRDAGALDATRISRDEAERLLDSMKRDEKNLQLWRFQQRKTRKPNEKDW